MQDIGDWNSHKKDKQQRHYDGHYAQDTAKELSVAFGSDEATAQTRPMSHGDLWFLTARFIGLKIEKAQADPPQDALVQFCVFGVAPF